MSNLHMCYSIFCEVINHEYRFFLRHRIGHIIMFIIHTILLASKYLYSIILITQHLKEINMTSIIIFSVLGLLEVFMIHILPLVFNSNPLMIFMYFDKLVPRPNNVKRHHVYMYITHFVLSICSTNSIQILLNNYFNFHKIYLFVPFLVFFVLGIIFMFMLCFYVCKKDIDSTEYLLQSVMKNDQNYSTV